MLSVDMPRSVRSNSKFRSIIFVDSIWMYLIAMFSLYDTVLFISILGSVAAYQLGIPPPAPFGIADNLLETFLKGVSFLLVILLFLSVLVMTLILPTDINKRLPVIVRAFAAIVLETIESPTLSKELLDSAQKLLGEGKYDMSILHAATSLEYELRRILNLKATESFAATLNRLGKIPSLTISPQQLDNIVLKRKQITCNAEGHNLHGKADAEAVVRNIDSILQQLKDTGISPLFLI